MNNSQLFKQAHKLTRLTIQKGYCYRTTFGACLKLIKSTIKDDKYIAINYSNDEPSDSRRLSYTDYITPIDFIEFMTINIIVITLLILSFNYLV